MTTSGHFKAVERYKFYKQKKIGGAFPLRQFYPFAWFARFVYRTKISANLAEGAMQMAITFTGR
jgi:hypothetical protein